MSLEKILNIHPTLLFLQLYMTKNDKYFTFFTKNFSFLYFEQSTTNDISKNHNKNSPKPINYGRVRGEVFGLYVIYSFRQQIRCFLR